MGSADAPPPVDARPRTRVTPETTDHLTVALELDGGIETPAELLAAGVGGVTARLPTLARGDLVAEQAVVVRLTSDRLHEPLRLEGQVVQARFGSEQPLEAGIAFVNWARNAHELEPVFRRLFNERRNFRVEPGLDDREQFKLVLRPAKGQRSMRAWIRDISASGVGIWVPGKRIRTTPPPEDEEPEPEDDLDLLGGGLAAGEPGEGDDDEHAPPPPLRGTHVLDFGGNDDPAGVGETVQLQLQMPRLRQALSLTCTVRHIAAWPGAHKARVGLALPDERDQSKELQHAILAYVTERQRKMRQMEADARERRAEEARPLEASGAALGKRRDEG